MFVVQNFQTNVFICYSDLTDNLRNRIEEGIYEKVIHDSRFKIERVLNFEVIDMPVLPNGVLVNLKVTAETMYPQVGQEYTFDSWTIKGDNVLVHLNGLQILCKMDKPLDNKTESIRLRIEKVRQIVDTLVCVGVLL